MLILNDIFTQLAYISVYNEQLNQFYIMPTKFPCHSPDFRKAVAVLIKVVPRYSSSHELRMRPATAPPDRKRLFLSLKWKGTGEKGNLQSSRASSI